jgi:hypothetical protein
VVISRFNENSKDGTVVIPEEDSPHGNIRAIHPSTMKVIELPSQQYESWKRNVYGSGNEGDFDDLFRKSWAVLHQMGYAKTARSAEGQKPQAVDPDKTDDPNKMSWKRYCEWRQEQEDRKRGAPRKGFVIPRQKR